MIEDAIIDILENHPGEHTIETLAQYISMEIDEIPETVEATIREMIESGRLEVKRDADGTMVPVVA